MCALLFFTCSCAQYIRGKSTTISTKETTERFTVLLDEIAEENIYLYGFGEEVQTGMVLYQNDAATYFSWRNATITLCKKCA
jgi:hypothetical protein